MRRVGLLTGALVMAACASWAQTNDVLWGSYQWSAVATGPTGLGVGGAHVAVMDDSSALPLNPAVLSTLTRTEGTGAGFQSPSASVLRGDKNESRTGLGVIGGGVLLTPKLAVGGFILQPRSVQTTFNEAPLPDGSRLSGSLRTVVTDAGASAALRLSSKLHVGGSLVGTHLELEGVGSRFGADGKEILRVGTSSGSTRFVAAVGALLEVSQSLHVGASAMSGAAWVADRTSVNPSLPLTLDPGSEYDVQRPLRASMGATWQTTRKLRVLAQVDYVAYGMIRDVVALRDVDGPLTLTLDNALEPRGGLELSLPFKNTGSLQVRAGLHSRAAGALASSGSNDVTQTATFPGGKRVLEASGGVSLLLSSFSAHAAYVDGSEAPLLVVGGSLRF